MAVGTGAFSSVSAERGVTMDVVGDEDAYLGIKIIDPKEHDDRIVINKEDGKTDILTLHNQFPYPISLTIWETDESSDNVSIVKFENVDIGTGHAETLAAECSADGTLILKFDAKIKDSDDQIIEAERSYDIECKGSEQEEQDGDGAPVQFAGNWGNVFIEEDNLPDGINFPDEVTVYYISNKHGQDPTIKRGTASPNPAGNLNSGPGSAKYVGIEISGIDGIYRRPQFDQCKNGSGESPSSNGKQDGELITPPEYAFGSCEITDNT